MNKSTFIIKGMDCPSEEALIKMKLRSFNNISQLEFDLENRRLTVYHRGLTREIESSLNDLDLDSSKIETQTIDDNLPTPSKMDEQYVLWIVLAINFGFFLVEGLAGFLSGSMGLVADGSDMLADAIVYGLSLYAVHKTVTAKRNVARLSGYFQLILAFAGFLEVIRRFMATDSPPASFTMIMVSLFALLGNATCLLLLKRVNNRDTHIKASLIFTSNDVIINIGVIVAGGLVYLLESNKPDLIVGAIVFLIVIRGALRILKLSTE